VARNLSAPYGEPPHRERLDEMKKDVIVIPGVQTPGTTCV